jgi:hypothetical protein
MYHVKEYSKRSLLLEGFLSDWSLLPSRNIGRNTNGYSSGSNGTCAQYLAGLHSALACIGLLGYLFLRSSESPLDDATWVMSLSWAINIKMDPNPSSHPPPMLQLANRS